MIVAGRQSVVNPNNGQAVVDKVNDTFLTQFPMYSIVVLLAVAGVLAVMAIIKLDRAIFNWVIGLLGLAALWIFIGGFFTSNNDNANTNTNTRQPVTNYYDQQTNQEVVAQKKVAIVKAFPELKDFETTEGFAGHQVNVSNDGSDHYFAYLTLGSGVPIAEATCYRVDRMMRVYKTGDFPDPLDSVAGYNKIDPKNCIGRFN